MKKPTSDASRTRKVDMSPRAIGDRLRRLEELFRLGMSLKRAKRISPPPEPEGKSRS